MTVSPLGDSAVVITLDHPVDPVLAVRVQAVAAEIRRQSPAGLLEVVPAFASIALFFEAGTAPEPADLEDELAAAVERAEAQVGATEARTVEIPVCYGDAHGPDLAEVATRAGLSAAEFARRHAGADYLVHAIGFSPGFPYLGGLPPELASPRRATPRSIVPAGAVGIGGTQTGIYPLATPGGWNLIGQTPLRLFDSNRPEPALLRAGDRVKFRSISSAEFSPSTGSPAPDLNEGEGIQIGRAGMFTTVQDLGRAGWRAEGVPLSGAADAFALRVANLLVGNPEGAAGFEITLVGPELYFPRDAIIALGGAEFEGLPSWRPRRVVAGTTLRLGAARSGVRGLLAVAGGLDVRPVLGSRSTYVRAGFGGLQGRVLRDHDVVPVGRASRTLRGSWYVDRRLLPAYSEAPCVRIVRGAQWNDFTPGSLDAPFTVSRQSDRMGLCLDGAALRRRAGGELLSAPVAPGTIQIPPDGRPIVLLADAPTIGGYPQIAHVATIDLPLLAQLRPGDTVGFREVPRGEARALVAAREQALALLRAGLREKWA